MPMQPTNVINKTLLDAANLHQQGRLDDAEALYLRVLKANPRSPDALNNLGYLYLQKKEYAIAVDILSNAVAVGPKNPEFHLNLSIAQKNTGQLDAAIKSLKLALKYEPDHPSANLNIANAYIEKGNFKIAKKFLKRTLLKEPNNPAALMNMGAVFINAGDFPAAIKILAKADKVAPNQPTLMCNLGVALMSDGQLDKSLVMFDRVIEIHPRFANAYINRGNALVAMNRSGEAVESFSQGRKLGVGNSKNLRQMTETSVDAGDYPGAIELLDIILEREPNDIDAIASLARALQVVGNIERSYELGHQMLAQDPDSIDAYYLLSTNKETAADPNFLANLERLEKNDNLSPALQNRIGVAMFRTLENLGEQGRAFAALKKGTDAIFQAKESPRNDYDERFKIIKNTFSPQTLKKTILPLNTVPEQKPIFIVGMPRSGTTLTEQIISSHSQVFGAGELPFIGLLDIERGTGLRAKKFSNPSFENLPSLDNEQLQDLAQTYIDNVPSHAEPYFTDKMPSNFLHIGLIHKLFPNATIIHCRREPAETCFSCFKQSFQSGHAYSYDLDELGNYYNFYEKIMAYWHEVLPGHILDIEYSDTVDDVDAQAKKLIKHCGLDWEDSCLDFHKSKRDVLTASVLQVRKPIYKSSLNSWAPYEKELDELFTALGEYAPKKHQQP